MSLKKDYPKLWDGLNKEARSIEYSFKEMIKSDGKVATGNLVNSIKTRVVEGVDSVEIEISGEEYLNYLDQGVNGLNKSYNSPFSFKYPKPSKKMVQDLSKWAQIKGIPQSAVYPIGITIKREGIKPSFFVKRITEKEFKKLRLLTNQLLKTDFTDIMKGEVQNIVFPKINF